MFYKPEIFVYLMLLPAVCLIIVPAFLATIRITIGAFKTTKVSETLETFDQEALAEA